MIEGIRIVVNAFIPKGEAYLIGSEPKQVLHVAEMPKENQPIEDWLKSMTLRVVNMPAGFQLAPDGFPLAYLKTDELDLWKGLERYV